MLKNIKDSIVAFYDSIKYLYTVFLDFMPSPLDDIFKAFCIILLILIIIKIINIVGGLVENLIGVFT